MTFHGLQVKLLAFALLSHSVLVEIVLTREAPIGLHHNLRFTHIRGLIKDTMAIKVKKDN